MVTIDKDGKFSIVYGKFSIEMVNAYIVKQHYFLMYLGEGNIYVIHLNI